MQKISVYIIAFNEAEKIRQAISSVLWADEIVVADSGSTDGTADMATALGARVVQVPFHGFGELRNSAVEACAHEWIFSLDADERCTAEVRDEVLKLLEGNASHDAYFVPRRNYFMGRWIQGSGWYPNFRQPQLFKKQAMRYSPDPVHERYVLTPGATTGVLSHAIWQLPFRNLEEVMRKANRYSSLGAEKLATRLAGRRVTMGAALTHAFWAFVKHYVFKRGFLDGWPGFVIAFGNFEGTFYRYAKRLEADSNWQLPEQAPLRRP